MFLHQIFDFSFVKLWNCLPSLKEENIIFFLLNWFSSIRERLKRAIRIRVSFSCQVVHITHDNVRKLFHHIRMAKQVGFLLRKFSYDKLSNYLLNPLKKWCSTYTQTWCLINHFWTWTEWMWVNSYKTRKIKITDRGETIPGENVSSFKNIGEKIEIH